MERRMHRRLAAVLAAFVLSITAVGPTTASDQLTPERGAPVADDRFESEGTGYWFVQLKSGPRVDGTTSGQLKKERDAFKADVSRERDWISGAPRIRHSVERHVS